MAIKDVARAFAYGYSDRCHNATTDGRGYRLHGSLIAYRKVTEDGKVVVVFQWCGWYSHTTANHMNHILDAIGADKHVSYASARDNGVTKFEVVI